MKEIQQVHYHEVTNVGECSKTLTISGSVDDVMKILGSTHSNKTNNNISIHVAPSEDKVVSIDFIEELKSDLEKVIKHV